MTMMIFGRAHVFPVILWVAVVGGLFAAAVALLYVLNEEFAFKRFFGKPYERFWALLSLAALVFFVRSAFDPFLPISHLGEWYWPFRLVLPGIFVRVLFLAPLGAVTFFIASDEGLAGGFWGWKPVLGPGLRRPIIFGSLVGAGLAVSGVFANRALFLAEAVMRVGYPDVGIFLLFGIPVFWILSAVAIIALPAYGWTPDFWQKLILGAGLISVWVIPVELGEAHFRLNWHYGPSSLASAVRLPAASGAPKVAILVLADRDRAPGRQYREDILASRGVSLDEASLRKLEAYLESNQKQTLFYSEAIAAIRRGWMLQWQPGKHLDAAAVQSGNRFPPDYEGFLEGIRVAPATIENRVRLAEMSELATVAEFSQVKTAQKMFEGFSAAYARYGDLEVSNAWLDRIRGLWPLFESDIHIEPIEDNFDGWIGGRLLYNGRPASGIRVGLFMLPSSMTIVGAYTGLVASTLPDESGRFVFTDLTTGDYYLALRADPLLLGGDKLYVRNAPGIMKLQFGAMTEALLPVEIGRGEAPPPRDIPLKPLADFPIKNLPGIGRSR